ncbi:MAG: hypothetical protein JXQ90_11050 [Cyclobacteriaceae bacterium]
MSDDLKKYVDQEREQFELYPYDLDQGWNELRERLPKTAPKESKPIWYMVAAGLAMLLMISPMLFNGPNSTESTVPSEIVEVQFYYNEIIDAKMTLVKSQVKDPEILSDIDALDEVFSELNEDLKDGVRNEEVVMAMIENYRLKLEILERILEDLEEDSHETNSNI